MRNMKHRRSSRQFIRRGRRGAALGAAVLAAVVVLGIAAGVFAVRMNRQDAREYTIPLTLDTPSPSPSPSATPTPTPTPAPEEEDRAESFEYLPVYRRANTERKRIAITVDDCFQVDNLKTIVDTVNANGGRFTIFPIGQNLEKAGMAQLLRRAVFELGDEIENHTWSHQRIFRLPEQQMAREIWAQGQAVNKALGVSYEQHFFRLMGGDGENDQRTHNYLDQLGFKGIASWSLSGSDANMKQIKSALKPGAVYLFHTTDGDTAKLRQFIPYAVSQGYELVTLNELFGLEANAVSEYAEREMPQPRAYSEDYRAHKQGDYAWNVVGMQDALRGMGYLKMSGPSTGYYGAQTAQAVKAWQRAEGLPGTGVADSETQKLLLKR